MKILQDYVAPYIRYDDSTQPPTIAAHGTAFFINSSGTFLTAGHVVKNCEADIKNNGGSAALLVRDEKHPRKRIVARIEQFNLADDPYDVAIGVINQQSKTKGGFVFGEHAKAWMWHDVWTAGYPESATLMIPGGFSIIDARGHKGQILRSLPAGHFLMHPHPDIFELSFAITKGISGAPLVKLNQKDQAGKKIPYFVLLGVCVGNGSSSLVDFAHEEVVDGVTQFKEIIKRIEEYGLAHDLRPLADWQPNCLKGASLRNAVQPTP